MRVLRTTPKKLKEFVHSHFMNPEKRALAVVLAQQQKLLELETELAVCQAQLEAYKTVANRYGAQIALCTRCGKYFDQPKQRPPNELCDCCSHRMFNLKLPQHIVDRLQRIKR